MEDLADRARAFEMFRKSYRKNEALDENRALLKDKYARGKELGNDVNESRNGIKSITGKIEQIRKENAMRGLVDPQTGEVLKTPEEEALQLQVNKLKMKYQEQYNELKELKAEIERIQKLLERSRERMQKDFESWLNVMIRQLGGQSASQQMSSSMGQTSASQAERTFNAGATDAKVNENLQAFYQARDAIYKDLK
ncbi:hypothetical protein FGO68_gene3267 [Halteria grandinella]|uniref:Kinesin-like protein KIF6/9 C-terminal domain-containing protein n=1 Tax=Halteria grandinella TaxID=5974 RepID=A0A8J8SVI4_HALGN|nr:hypothetical protein FGO68_gene3267 [Halteria grandinella]